MAHQLEPGSVLEGRYRLHHRLGEGGMGVVWAGDHTITGRAVAIKVLKGADGRPSVRRRFIREARATSMIDHPGAVRVLDAFELPDGTPALVMDLLEGETLAARMARGKLSLAETAAVVVPIASVLATAHARGVVHRDLKPENVFLTRDSDSSRAVRVLDFGIAKLASGEWDVSEPATRAGAPVGTPCYMAPEQAVGETDLDHRVDVWALGVIAYEALTGGRPFEADHLGQLVKRMLSDAIVPVEELVDGIPSDVASLVSRMLSRDREDRPRDLDEVVEVFGRHADAETAAPVVPVAARPRRPWRRRARAALLLAPTLAAATLAWVVLAADRHEPRSDEPSAPPISATAPTPTEAATETTASSIAAPAPPAEDPPVAAATVAPAKTAMSRERAHVAGQPPASGTASPPPRSSRPGVVMDPPY